MSRIIVFVGLVGAGKSTQMGLLSAFLKRKKIKVKSVTLKTIFPLTSLSSKLLYKMGVKKITLTLQKSLVQIDLSLNLFLLPVLSFRIRLLKRLGYLLLVEEYLPGILVDYYHLAKIYKLHSKLILNFMSAIYKTLFLSEMSTILLVCDNNNLPARWRKRRTIPEHYSYLESQQTIFRILKRTMNPFYCFSTDVNVNCTFFNLVSAVIAVPLNPEFSS